MSDEDVRSNLALHEPWILTGWERRCVCFPVREGGAVHSAQPSLAANSAFSSVFLPAGCGCAPLAALSQASSLKWQKLLRGKLARCHMVASARMRSQCALSPRGLQRSVLETHFTASGCCNSPSFHSIKCLFDQSRPAGIKTIRAETLRWLLSIWKASNTEQRNIKD